MEETFLWRKKRTTVECQVCFKRCSLKKNEIGSCGVRKSDGKKIVLENFGKLVGLEIGKIEDRNIYHFLPDTDTLSVALSSNWKLFFDPIKKTNKTMLPKDLVAYAEKKGVSAIVFTGTEPSVHVEYVYRVARQARRDNIRTLIVTTGAMSEESFKKLSKYVDGLLLHFIASGSEEASKYFDFVSPKQAFKIARLAMKYHLHLEIANNVSTQLGDSPENMKKFAQWIVGELGSEVALHLLPFTPTGKLKLLQKPTLKELKLLAQSAKSAGLRYVYIGGVKEKTEWRNTYCYNCRQLLIERKRDGRVKINNLKTNHCPYCGVKIRVVLK